MFHKAVVPDVEIQQMKLPEVPVAATNFQQIYKILRWLMQKGKQ